MIQIGTVVLSKIVKGWGYHVRSLDNFVFKGIYEMYKNYMYKIIYVNEMSLNK